MTKHDFPRWFSVSFDRRVSHASSEYARNFFLSETNTTVMADMTETSQYLEDFSNVMCWVCCLINGIKAQTKWNLKKCPNISEI